MPGKNATDAEIVDHVRTLLRGPNHQMLGRRYIQVPLTDWDDGPDGAVVLVTVDTSTFEVFR